MNIACVVGTRPNFMKMAPLLEELKKRGEHPVLIHTGQHYDKAMSEEFFEQLGMPKPDVQLESPTGNAHQQFGSVMLELYGYFSNHKPDMVIVVGDVTSTLAGAFAASQFHIPVAHVEAGLRSFDRAMPEESNRILTDQISTYLFTTEKSADQNLQKENVDRSKIHFVGNVMIDTLMKHQYQAEQSTVLASLGLESKQYALVTLHRPSNVDTQQGLLRCVELLKTLAHQHQVLLPLHPRTKKRLEEFSLLEQVSKLVTIVPPQKYLDFLHLMSQAQVVVSDSGGIQEETTVLGVPCITYRENTERPVTVEQGTNLLVSTDLKEIKNALTSIPENPDSKRPELWDGNAAKRIVDILLSQ